MVAVDDTSGRDLARRLRELLPEHRRDLFDDMLELFTSETGGVSWCGAFAALSAPFNALVEASERPAIAAILGMVDDVLASSEPAPGSTVDGSGLHNSVLACFLENVLPVRADRFTVVAPLIGLRTRRWAEQHDPWWLEPAPGPAARSRGAPNGGK